MLSIMSSPAQLIYRTLNPLTNRIIVALFLALPVLTTTAQAADVAVITSLAGDVKVQQPTKESWVKGSLMLGLSIGAKIKMASGGKSEVTFYQNGARYALNASSIVAIESNTC